MILYGQKERGSRSSLSQSDCNERDGQASKHQCFYWLGARPRIYRSDSVSTDYVPGCINLDVKVKRITLQQQDLHGLELIENLVHDPKPNKASDHPSEWNVEKSKYRHDESLPEGLRIEQHPGARWNGEKEEQTDY